jgi:aryl-alcohol dehydrogenase-like predicted oxidoreductase
MLGGQVRSPDDFEEGDMRTYAPRFSAENFPKNLKLVDCITAIAKRKNCTPSQLTLAWILAQGQDFFPIPGTTSPERIEENGGALKVDLSKEDEAEIRKACVEAEPAGERYPEAYADGLYADTPPL